MDVDLRPVTSDEMPTFSRAVGLSFGNHMSDEEAEAWSSITEPDNTLAAFEDQTIVGTAALIPFELTLPGGTVTAVAGVTAVGVRPTHRRRGLLRIMMERQLEDVAARGQSLAILTASESAIYRRFGYGAATDHVSVSLESDHSEFTSSLRDEGSVEMVDNDFAREELPRVHDQARRAQTADIDRRDAWWDMFCRDAEWMRNGEGKAFFVVHRSTQGKVDGWLVYRVERSWPDGLARNSANVIELGATDPIAEAALWRYVLDIDLVSEVKSWKRPLDEPLRHLLADPRRLRTTTLRDDLWVRIVDVPAALSARRYQVEGDLVIAVEDPFRPQSAGRFHLAAGPEDAQCVPTGRPPDLTMDAAALGSSYLGNSRFAILASAGLVTQHSEGAIRLADLMFASHDVPFCRTGF